MAYRTKQFGPSARLYAGVLFGADPKLAEDVKSHNRYDAACAAALAGAGKPDEKPPLDEKDKARWRKQALDWLRADLVHWTKQAETGKPEATTLVGQTLGHWKVDSDLAGIRDEAALKALPEDERKAFRVLWAEVDWTWQRPGQVPHTDWDLNLIRAKTCPSWLNGIGSCRVTGGG